ncbi:MAG TPA: hypothetical protein VFV86_10565 [Nitrososphaeraceae archaeon]|nr:hypothetical protein [Nitrososphaeraceae archaeon]
MFTVDMEINNNCDRFVTKPWLANKHGSRIFVIPKKILKNCNITNNDYITIENDENGNITIKKLAFEQPLVNPRKTKYD